MKAHWDEMLRQYPDNSIPRMCEGIIGLVDRRSWKRMPGSFSQRHPVKQGAKQMEQHLERLRVAVALPRNDGGTCCVRMSGTPGCWLQRIR